MNRIACVIVLTAVLAACANAPAAHIPVSGVSGPNGGADETVYYDQGGHAHFQN